MMKYDKYKETGIELLEGIPATWTVGRLKDISNMNEKSLTDKISKDYQFKYVDISNVNQNGLIQEPETVTFSEAPSRARRIVRENDIIISTVRTYLKAIAFFDFYPKDYIASTGFAVLTPNKKIDAKFLAFYSQSELLVDLVIRFSTGVSYPAINSTTLSCLYVYLPSKEEQISIANYLNTKTQAIDKKINLLTKKAEYYKELRKSIINDAVCKGLDKNVKLKESGIEWIGEIPEHWEIKRLGELFIERSEKVSDMIYPPLSVSMNGIVPQMEGTAKTIHNDDRKKVLSGDFVINSRSDRRGSSGLSKYRGSVSVINIVLKPKKNALGKYYHHLFRSFSFTEEFYKCGKGIVDDLWATKYSVMRTFMVCVPPLEEQTTIANYLDEKTKKIDAIINNLQSTINHYKELRKTLINDVVTGKIKVTNN